MVDINQAQPAQSGAATPTGAPPDAGGSISTLTAQVREKIKIPPNLKQAYQRLVSAGLQIMFSAKTHKIMLDAIKAGGDLGKNVGEGAAGLVFLLWKQSKGAPPQLMIPVGMEFICQAFEYIEKTNIVPFTPANLSQAIKVMMRTLLKQAGGNVAALDNAMGAAAQPAAPGPAAPPGGLIGNQMGAP